MATFKFPTSPYLNCGDELISVLDGLDSTQKINVLGTVLLRANVIASENPYTCSNIGVQVMALTNKARVALRKGVITYSTVREAIAEASP